MNGWARNERDSSCTRRGLPEERAGGPGRMSGRARNERDSSCTRRGLPEERAGGPGRMNGWARNERDSSCTRRGLPEERAAARPNGPRQNERAGPQRARLELHSPRAAGSNWTGYGVTNAATARLHHFWVRILPRMACRALDRGDTGKQVRPPLSGAQWLRARPRGHWETSPPPRCREPSGCALDRGDTGKQVRPPAVECSVAARSTAGALGNKYAPRCREPIGRAVGGGGAMHIWHESMVTGAQVGGAWAIAVIAQKPGVKLA